MLLMLKGFDDLDSHCIVDAQKFRMIKIVTKCSTATRKHVDQKGCHDLLESATLWPIPFWKLRRRMLFGKSLLPISPTHSLLQLFIAVIVLHNPI